MIEYRMQKFVGSCLIVQKIESKLKNSKNCFFSIQSFSQKKDSENEKSILMKKFDLMNRWKNQKEHDNAVLNSKIKNLQEIGLSEGQLQQHANEILNLNTEIQLLKELLHNGDMLVQDLSEINKKNEAELKKLKHQSQKTLQEQNEDNDLKLGNKYSKLRSSLVLKSGAGQSDISYFSTSLNKIEICYDDEENVNKQLKMDLVNKEIIVKKYKEQIKVLQNTVNFQKDTINAFESFKKKPKKQFFDMDLSSLKINARKKDVKISKSDSKKAQSLKIN